MSDTGFSYSVIVPAYNEEHTLSELVRRIHDVMNKLGKSYELIIVNDGSTDNSESILNKLSSEFPNTVYLTLRRRFGQTAAMVAGFDASQGEILLTLDGDLQNQPEDIEKLVCKLDEGYDVVSGWRKNRKDKWFSRILPSIIANWLISRWTGLDIHDIGCTLKAYRRNALKDIKLYGEMHRYIPIYLNWAGYKVTEVEVQHMPRKSGKSKYGLSRIGRVILDLLTAKFLNSWSQRPGHIFGGFGICFLGFGALCAAITLVQKFALGAWVHRNPLFLVALFLAISGLQLILIGFVAELVMRVYHESLDKPTYVLKDVHRSSKLNDVVTSNVTSKATSKSVKDLNED